MRGYLSKTVVAGHLGVKRGELDRLIAEDHLPTVKFPGQARPVVKIHAAALYEWERGLSSGGFPTYPVWVENLSSGKSEIAK